MPSVHTIVGVGSHDILEYRVLCQIMELFLQLFGFHRNIIRNPAGPNHILQ